MINYIHRVDYTIEAINVSSIDYEGDIMRWGIRRYLNSHNTISYSGKNFKFSETYPNRKERDDKIAFYERLIDFLNDVIDDSDNKIFNLKYETFKTADLSPIFTVNEIRAIVECKPVEDPKAKDEEIDFEFRLYSILKEEAEKFRKSQEE